ncbi:MAG: hypothetical protein AAGF31_09970 [Planctomycetota bacterium]
MNISANGAIESLLAAEQGATQSKIAYAIAAKGQDAQQAAGDAAIQLLEAATQLGKAPGKGAHFDAVR